MTYKDPPSHTHTSKRKTDDYEKTSLIHCKMMLCINFRLIDWCLMPTLAIFQLYSDVAYISEEPI